MRPKRASSRHKAQNGLEMASELLEATHLPIGKRFVAV